MRRSMFALRLTDWRVLSLAGLACVLGALGILAAAGLPDRATASALYLLPDGQAVAAEVGAIAPPLGLSSADGDHVTLESQRGRVVVLNYWATWCGPCRAEMPALEAIARRHPDRLTVLGINAGEPLQRVVAWREAYGLTFPLLLDPQGTAATSYRLRGQPTTIIVAPDGRITKILYGPADIPALEGAIAHLLAESANE